MKKSTFNPPSGKTLFPLIFLLLLGLCNKQLVAQELCGTVASAGSIGRINNVVPPTNNTPIYLRIYIFAVGKDDGSGAPTLAEIRQSLWFLRRDFDQHNIFFVWDNCIVTPVNSTVLYNTTQNLNLSDFVTSPLPTDGISIFIGGDGAPSHGWATNIPSTSFIIKGSWASTVGACTGVIEWIGSKSHYIAHEMGHTLGLWHTHHPITEVNDEPLCTNTDMEGYVHVIGEYVDGSNGATCGDYVADTPADPKLHACFTNIYQNCAWVVSQAVVDQHGQPYNPDISLIMSYTHERCMTRFSLGQVDRMRQIIAISSALQTCIIAPDFAGVNITSDDNWTTSNKPHNGNFLIEGDLTIEGGKTLTINAGVTVHFGEQSKLIIKPNAKLVLNGTLTGMGCRGYTWQGVQVWGSNSSKSQYAVNGVRAQGRIVCQTGSVIENAKVGIQLFGPTVALSGGQIQCTGATIRNCSIGVSFAPYRNFWPFPLPAPWLNQPRNYDASFSGVTFVTDNEYPHSEPFYAFNQLEGVNGPKYSGCTFTNTRTITGSSIADWGYGILATDAGFTVQGPISGPLPATASSFTGLGYGIYAGKALTNRPFIVQETTFEKCFVGIHNRSVNGSTVVLNKFKMGILPSMVPTPNQVGVIYDTDISGLTCEENTFSNLGSPLSVVTIGTISIKTGLADKTIRRNTYNNLKYSNVANYVNGSLLPNEGVRGLYYDCNQHFNVSGTDVYVPKENIKSKQGLEVPNPINPSIITYNAAGNRFSYTAVDIAFYGQAMEYFFDQSSQNEEPLTIVGNVTKTAASDNLCLSTYCKPPCKTEGEIIGIKNDFYGKRSAYQTVKSDNIANPTVGKSNTLAYYQRIMDENAYMVALHQMYDTLAYKADTLRTWIGNIGSLESDLWLATEYLYNGQVPLAVTLLNNAVTKYQLTGTAKTDVQKFKALLNVLKGKPFYALDDATLQLVRGYLDVGGSTGAWAKNILTLYGGHFPPDYTLSALAQRPDALTPLFIEKDNPTEWLKVHPNPAKDFVEFSFNIPAGVSDVSIQIFDLNGKMVVQEKGLSGISSYTWQTDGSSSGIYFYHLTGNSSILQSGKIVLNK